MASPLDSESPPAPLLAPTLVPPEPNEEKTVEFSEILYGIESFYAIVKPVFLTMVLAALASVYINTEESTAQGQAALSGTYTVFDTASDDNDNTSTTAKLGESLVNGLVIVSVICALTFVIVLLYKYRCMKILKGYMIFASIMLLGFLSSVMFQVAIDKYQLRIDVISFYAFIYNFCIVGTAAIFFGKGFPMYVTQGYLIATSVIVSWQLTHFDEWTAWVLLVLLALYDLFAVLTPCGPLKALVKLMQREDAPDMPGLLYEASLPSGTTARRRQNTTTTTQQREPAPPTTTQTSSSSDESTVVVQANEVPLPLQPVVEPNENSTEFEVPRPQSRDTTESEPLTASTLESGAARSSLAACTSATTPTATMPASTPAVDRMDSLLLEEQVPTTALIPLALAKLYKLKLVDDPCPPWRQPVDVDDPPIEYTADELDSLVEVVFAVGGGRVRQHAAQRENEAVRYQVIDREGNQKRILFVLDGKVMEDLREKNAAEEAANPSSSRNSIRLGLGDFIFYSILVAKAALYSFTTFAACTVAILTGLGLTLLLLAVYGKALPALPISIFLGVIFYLLTRYSMEPWVQDVFIENCYV